MSLDLRVFVELPRILIAETLKFEVVLGLDVVVLIAVRVACEVDLVSSTKVMSRWTLKYFYFPTSVCYNQKIWDATESRK